MTVLRAPAAVALFLALVACAAPDRPAADPTSTTLTSATTLSATSGSPTSDSTTTTTEDVMTTTDTPAAQGTAVRITVGDTTVTATLDANPSARDLLGRLPLTLTLRDFGGVEKTAGLDRPLTLDGAPRGSDPAPADIGYYAPNQVLVLYYGDVGYFAGIVGLGRFDPAAADLVAGLPDDTTVTLDRD